MVHILVESNDMDEFNDFMKISLEPGIEVIHEKSFNGLTNLIEIFIDAIPVIAVISPIIIEKIKKKKISKIKIDGEKIEIENISEELLKEIIEKKFSEDGD